MARKRRNRRRVRRRSGSTIWKYILGVILIILVVAALAAVFYIYYSKQKSHVALDEDTNCPTSSPPSHITALVVDATDALNQVQQSSVRNVVDQLVAEIPRFGALAIYVVSTDSETQSHPIFYRCNPGRGGDIDPMFGNPEKVENLWKKGFRNALNEELDKNLDSGVANSSPIMESVLWVAIQHFDKLGHDQVPRTLAVISDLLQHTDGYSHYRTRADFSTFENSQYYRKVRANLLGVEARLWQIRRNTERQNSDLEKFWRTFFQAQGASNVSFQLLPG